MAAESLASRTSPLAVPCAEKSLCFWTGRYLCNAGREEELCCVPLCANRAKRAESPLTCLPAMPALNVEVVFDNAKRPPAYQYHYERSSTRPYLCSTLFLPLLASPRRGMQLARTQEVNGEALELRRGNSSRAANPLHCTRPTDKYSRSHCCNGTPR